MISKETIKFLLEQKTLINQAAKLADCFDSDFSYALYGDDAKKVADALDSLLDPYIVVPGEIKVPNEPGQILVDYPKQRKKVNK